ncbi:MAG: cation transporter [Truepera sp.]|nr:cation transporter [Truepera sp.]
MMELKITGMTCGHCQAAVKSALESVAGVEAVHVDLKNGYAKIEGSADMARLLAAVEAEGYQATVVDW